MNHKTLFALWALLTAVILTSCAPRFELQSGEEVTVVCSEEEATVVFTALNLLERDLEAVLTAPLHVTSEAKGAKILVGTLGQSPLIEQVGVDLTPLAGKHEAFLLATTPDGRLLIAGSDKRGTAYGIMEFSRLIGVSPWEWWADATPEKLSRFTLPKNYLTTQAPSVAYRGIFLNDEDWGLTPWSWLTYEPSEVEGRIGPKTHERIFELLLRLRANTFWPAMHECSVPFYFTEGNKEVADRFGIFIGTSHCEPMMRNTNGEWRRDGIGDYDYVHNSDHVRAFWEERTKEVAQMDNLYTLGMRGVHDGAMNGAKTLEDQKAVLTRVLKDQRALLARHVREDVTTIPQVFIPYKEVLDIYHAGLEVPDEVTLMWCDDNYGYIRHFPTPEERARKGGNGVYYHVSYWGRPHDYLWLSSAHPALVYHQMMTAYERGIQKIWVLNVGDIKPAEYQIELFLDMAWNLEAVKEQGVEAHLNNFLTRELGAKVAKRLMPLMQEYYRLAYIRKPEFMGNTRTEERDPAYKVVKDLPWSEEEINTRLAAYTALAEEVEQLSAKIPTEKQPTWFQLAEYPLRGAAEMNKKHLYAQLARHGLAAWEKSDEAFQTIVALTERYNTQCDGKWNRMMDYAPRRLAVYHEVPHTEVAAPLVVKQKPLYLLNGQDYASYRGEQPVGYAMGYQSRSLHIKKGSSVTYEVPTTLPDSIAVTVALAPYHPIEGEQIRYAISINDEQPCEVDYRTVGRSEEWKENVLNNRAVRTTHHRTDGKKKCTITLTALDEGVVVDQICLNLPPTTTK